MNTDTESNTKLVRLPWLALFVGFVACLAPVFIAGGISSGFTYWNALPILLGFVALSVFGLRSAASWFALVAIGVSELFHLAWLGDWGGTATGSSTSAIAFVFVPVWSIIFGLIAAFVAWLVSLFWRRTPPQTSDFSRRNPE